MDMRPGAASRRANLTDCFPDRIQVFARRDCNRHRVTVEEDQAMRLIFNADVIAKAVMWGLRSGSRVAWRFTGHIRTGIDDHPWTDRCEWRPLRRSNVDGGM